MLVNINYNVVGEGVSYKNSHNAISYISRVANLFKI